MIENRDQAPSVSNAEDLKTLAENLKVNLLTVLLWQKLNQLTKNTMLLQEQFDKSFGYCWNVVCGEYFTMSITYQEILFMFRGSKAFLIWRSTRCLEQDIRKDEVPVKKIFKRRRFWIKYLWLLLLIGKIYV